MTRLASYPAPFLGPLPHPPSVNPPPFPHRPSPTPIDHCQPLKPALPQVSTLMAEARALPEPRFLLRYLGATHGGAQLLLLAINLPVWIKFGGV